MNKQKRILIVRPDRIGDVVLSTPLPREIKKTYPDSFVAVLLRSYTKAIYENNPFVDEIILVDDVDSTFTSFWHKIREIKKYKFTHSLTLLPTEKLNYILFFSGIPYRIGVGHKFYQFITFTKYVSRNKYIPLRHEADYCMDLARRIGITSINLNTEIFLTDDEKKKSLAIRQELLNGKKIIVGIHSTSGNSAPNWKAESYKELIEKLLSIKEIKVIITDSKVPEILKGHSDIAYPNVYTTLRESIINFAALDLLISASTGPMHICSALKVKTLSMFCPLTACSPKLWGPLGNESRVVLPTENYCQSVCPGDPKKCSFEGEGGISPNLIYSEVKKLLLLN